MPVAIIMDFKDATLDQYDQVLEKMGLSPGGSGPPGALFHWATKTDNGFRVVDVWESREQFDKFADDQIGPHTQAVGMNTPPEIHFHDVYSHLTAG